MMQMARIFLQHTIVGNVGITQVQAAFPLILALKCYFKALFHSLWPICRKKVPQGLKWKGLLLIRLD